MATKKRTIQEEMEARKKYNEVPERKKKYKQSSDEIKGLSEDMKNPFIFKNKLKREHSKPETLGGICLVKKDGYIPTRKRVAMMMTEGMQRNLAFGYGYDSIEDALKDGFSTSPKFNTMADIRMELDRRKTEAIRKKAEELKEEKENEEEQDEIIDEIRDEKNAGEMDETDKDNEMGTVSSGDKK